MRRSVVLVLALVVVLIAAVAAAIAMQPARLPPPKAFLVQGGGYGAVTSGTYRWDVAHGVTGSLSISGPPAPNGSNIFLVLTCSGLHSGGVQARFYEPKPNAAQLRVRISDKVFRVYRGIETLEGKPFVGGMGDLPSGYFDALATTPTLSVEYAGQVVTFAGPGKDLAEHFRHYCKTLARRADRDEG